MGYNIPEGALPFSEVVQDKLTKLSKHPHVSAEHQSIANGMWTFATKHGYITFKQSKFLGGIWNIYADKGFWSSDWGWEEYRKKA